MLNLVLCEGCLYDRLGEIEWTFWLSLFKPNSEADEFIALLFTLTHIHRSQTIDECEMRQNRKEEL